MHVIALVIVVMYVCWLLERMAKGGDAAVQMREEYYRQNEFNPLTGRYQPRGTMGSGLQIETPAPAPEKKEPPRPHSLAGLLGLHKGPLWWL
jgi:hypothetical protein